MDKAVWIILVVAAGAVLPFQAGLNTRMGKAIDSAVGASLFSFVVGAIALLLYALATKNTIQLSGIKSVPATTWLAGVLGAFYVATVVTVFPKLGPALTFSLVVAGQLLVSLLLDHFNILVHQQHSINLYRVVGMFLIIGGVILIRKF